MEELIPITREELFLAKAGGMDVQTPNPISRRELFLQKIIDNMGGQGSGGNADYVLTAADKEEIAEIAAGLVEVPEGSGSGISVTGATVGQTVKIAEVDENGAPTAWESVDFPSGGDKGAFRLIRTVTIPEDPSTDTSGVTWVERENGGYWFGFDTDENGNPFEISELIVVVNTAIAKVEEGSGDPTLRFNCGATPYYGSGSTAPLYAWDNTRSGAWSWFQFLGTFSMWMGSCNAGSPIGAMSGTRALLTQCNFDKVTSISTWNSNGNVNGFVTGEVSFYGR